MLGGRSRPSGQSRGFHVPSAELQPASTTKRDGWQLTTVEALGGVTEQRPWLKKFWERIYIAARKAVHDDASSPRGRPNPTLNPLPTSGRIESSNNIVGVRGLL